MIYHIFIYKTNKIRLLWQKSICSNLAISKTEWILSVIDLIIPIIEQTLNANLEEIKSISLGDYSLYCIPLPNLSLYLVFFLDKSDISDLLQISHRLIRLVATQANTLVDIHINPDKSAIFDSDILKILAENKQFFIISNKEIDQLAIYDALLNLLPNISNSEKDTLLKERNSLEFSLRSPLNFIEKQQVLLQLQKISRQLKDRNGNQKYTNQLKMLTKEVNDTKFRAIFLLKQTKESINTSIEHAPHRSIADIDLGDAYLKLYSFSQKLHFLGRTDLADEYRKIAQLLLDKPENRLHEFSGLISQILNLPENIDMYLKAYKNN